MRGGMEIGYWLASEEQGPHALVENARRAEDAGFTHVCLHSFTEEQADFIEFARRLI
jgi:hypothetical protein